MKDTHNNETRSKGSVNLPQGSVRFCKFSCALQGVLNKAKKGFYDLSKKNNCKKCKKIGIQYWQK